MEFARAGAHVTFCARDRIPHFFNGSSAEKEISSDEQVRAAGGSVKFIRADATNRTEIRAVLDDILNRFNRLDIAINNHGITGYSGRIHEIPSDEIFGEHDPILNNLYGTLICMQEEIHLWVTEHIRKFNGSAPPRNLTSGVIVNLSSVSGLRSTPYDSMYSASKYGINGLTTSAALEFSEPPTARLPRLRINALAPGAINTPMIRNLIKFDINGTNPWEGRLITEDDPDWKRAKPQFEAGLVGKRLGTPKEMAEVILFLSSEKSSYITGTVVSADFGLIARS